MKSKYLTTEIKIALKNRRMLNFWLKHWSRRVRICKFSWMSQNVGKLWTVILREREKGKEGGREGKEHIPSGKVTFSFFFLSEFGGQSLEQQRQPLVFLVFLSFCSSEVRPLSAATSTSTFNQLSLRSNGLIPRVALSTGRDFPPSRVNSNLNHRACLTTSSLDDYTLELYSINSRFHSNFMSHGWKVLA